MIDTKRALKMSSSFSSERGTQRPKLESALGILDESDGEDTDKVNDNIKLEIISHSLSTLFLNLNFQTFS